MSNIQIFVVSLVALVVLVGCKCGNTNLDFREGDVVRIKMTGDTGYVKGCSQKEVGVKYKTEDGFKVEDFEPYALRKLGSLKMDSSKKSEELF